VRRADLSSLEQDALEKVCSEESIRADDLLLLLEVESSFQNMGRRRGLFDALRGVIEDAALSSEVDALMRLAELTIENFRVYRGRHHLTFERPQDGRNVYLIGGLNGAGKTSLFAAIVAGFMVGKLSTSSSRERRRER